MNQKIRALLSQERFFEQWQRRLAGKVMRQVENLLGEDDEICPDEVADSIVAMNQLEPLEVGDVEAVLMETQKTVFRNSYSVLSSGFLTQGRIPYRGSRALWGALPYRGFEWGMTGIVEQHFVWLTTYMDDRDYEATLAMFRRELEIAREGIDRMNPSVVLLNVQLEEPLRELARDCLDRLRGEAN